MKKLFYLLLCTITFSLISCAEGKLLTSDVAYQSIRTKHAQPTNDKFREDAKIIVGYSITPHGRLVVSVKNNTSEIMIIDQAKSFFVDSDGSSTSYYDPTVRTTSTTNLSSSTSGGSVNLGAIGGAFGVGGSLGTALSGINLGSSGTKGQSVTNTTYTTDLLQISISPKGEAQMSKSFEINGIGKSYLKYKSNIKLPNINNNESYCKFSVCISYSIDGGKTFDKLVTEFYANSLVVVPVRKKGFVNNALNEVFATKTDALNEKWWMLYFVNNIPNARDTMVEGVLLDYK